jgi:hypothetical protein
MFNITSISIMTIRVTGTGRVDRDERGEDI